MQNSKIVDRWPKDAGARWSCFGDMNKTNRNRNVFSSGDGWQDSRTCLQAEQKGGDIAI